MVDRFKDPGMHLYDFADHYLVECPDCNRCATITTNKEETFNLFKKKTFLCRYCGKFEENAGNHDLWLSGTCNGNTLWAYNLEHLEFIEKYVKAKLRESNKDDERGYYNQGLFSRLPKWIKDKSNREDILKTIKKLRNTVKSGSV
ncbi:hypothetical protein FACS1894172_04830 [Spirochaetia bacterium]|nr:hypothetical protein FACS1894164_05570 [Spirochaetia bacterium]GHU30867.1 hypothetical protein FACS1894172_04830 [Spirochaetia bacterium]